MARIRTIKPEFPQSESMGRVSRDARLLFIELWTICDDSGRTRGNSRMLASLLFPYDDDAPELIDGWLAELEREECVVRYQADGGTYLQVCNWLNHQKIDKPSPSKIPAFSDEFRILANTRESSPLDQGPKDQGVDQEKDLVLIASRKESAKAEQFNPTKYLLALGVSEKVASDWLTLRKQKKAGVTQTAIDGVAKQAAKAGWLLEDALSHCCAKGWQGFDADWVAPKQAPQQGLPGLARAI